MIRTLFMLIALISLLAISCRNNDNAEFPDAVTIKGIALNPEGIEYNRNDRTFFLSSLNAAPITQVRLDGTYKPFTHGEKFPLSTAGLQIDYKRNRLLAAGFNGTELMDNDPATRGTAFLRSYNLKTGALEQDINLSYLAPDAQAYFANDIAVDNDGNVYISDWYAGLIYKVDIDGKPTLFWKNETGIPGGPNGIDFHPGGYLLVSLLSVNKKGLYTDYGLIKIPVNNPVSTTIVNISDAEFSGFDGMVITSAGNVVGVTNNGKSAGGNTLIELMSADHWESAKVIHAGAIKPSTTVAVIPGNKYYVINQDFSDNFAENWTIKKITF